MPSSAIWRKFIAAHPSLRGESPLPPHVLTHQLLQDLSSCLNPSNIPSYPFDRSAAVAVTEAIDALRILARLAYTYPEGTPWHHEAIEFLLPSTWKWIAFISPRSGTIADMDDDGCRSDIRVSSDGCLEMTTAIRFATMAMYILPLAVDRFPRGIEFLAAQPDFSDVALSMLHHTFRPSSASVAGYHRYVTVIGCLLVPHESRLYKRLRDDFLSCNERHHPGRALRMILERMEWAYYGEYASEAEESEQVKNYVRMFCPKESFWSDDAMMANLKAAGMAASLARILRRATARTDFENDHSHRRSLLGIWSRTLDVLFNMYPGGPSLSLSDVTAALRHGLLTVLYRAICTKPCTGDKEALISNFRPDATNIAGRTLLTALVWPRVLRAFDIAFYREQLDEATDGYSPPEWAVLISRYQLHTRTRQDYNANIARLRERCGNAECSFSETETRLKICPCATVSYCSKACQKADWRARHRGHCSIIRSSATMVSAETKFSAHIPDIMSFTERIYLQRCATDYVAEFGDPDAMRDARSVLVDLADPHRPYPSIKYSELDNFPGFEEFDVRYIHIFVRVLRGGYTFLLETDVNWRH